MNAEGYVYYYNTIDAISSWPDEPERVSLDNNLPYQAAQESLATVEEQLVIFQKQCGELVVARFVCRVCETVVRTQQDEHMQKLQQQNDTLQQQVSTLQRDIQRATTVRAQQDEQNSELQKKNGELQQELSEIASLNLDSPCSSTKPARSPLANTNCRI